MLEFGYFAMVLRSGRHVQSIQGINMIERTFPMSVTLTALSKLQLCSSTTAMLLTPSSLISFIASKTEAEEEAEITAAFRFREGKDRDCIGFERYFLKDGVARA